MGHHRNTNSTVIDEMPCSAVYIPRKTLKTAGFMSRYIYRPRAYIENRPEGCTMKEMDGLIRAATQIVAADIEERQILDADIVVKRQDALRENAERMANARHELCKCVTSSRELMCQECKMYPRDWPSRLCPGCAEYALHTAI